MQNYTGGRDLESGKKFISERFLELNTSPHKTFTHFTIATDPANMEIVFVSVRKTILTEILGGIFF